MSVKRIQFIRSLFILGVCLVCFSGRAQAAPVSPAQGIQVSPPLLELNGEKGNSYRLETTVTNLTAETQVLRAVINDFKAKDESGNPEIILQDASTDPTFSFKSWAKPIGTITLKPKESRKVSVDVTIPASAEAGGHYGVIRFTSNPPGIDEQNVSIAASVGVLVLTRVKGDIKESLNIDSMFVESKGKKTSLAQSGPLTFVERLTNTGNVHVKPSGVITVKNFFGNKIAELPIAKSPGNVLPKSTRRYTQDLQKKWLFGKYTASIDITYGYSNQTLSQTISFWVIPFRLIFIILIVILFVFFILRRVIKGYNRRIIARAKRH